MKTRILIPAFILLAFVSCNNSRKEEKHEQKAETPKVLKEESSYEMASKRGSDEVMESLYKELADKTPALKELEDKFDILSASKSDSTALYDKYNGKNQSYYSSADSHIKQINDSVLTM